MKRTQWIDAFRNIAQRKASFISVCAISFLAVIVYLCVTYASKDMHQEFSDFYNKLSFWDLEILSTRFITKEDVEQMEATEGVAAAEGVMLTPVFTELNGELQEVNAISLTKRVAMPELVSGTLPKASDECAVERELAEKYGFHVGDEMMLTNSEGEQANGILGQKYHITAIIHHPDHIAYGIAVTFYVVLPEEAFDKSMIGECYTKAFVRLLDMPEDRFTKEYYDAVKPMRKKLEALAETRCALRDEELDQLAQNAAMLPGPEGAAMRNAIPGGTSRWMIMSNTENVGYAMAEQNSNNLVTLSLTLSLLFVAVAVMVIYACTSRMVEEQSVLVGGLKACGLHNHEIIGKYLVFALSAGLIGAILGVLGAWCGLQKFILVVYSSYFVCGLSHLAFLPIPAVIASLCILASTALAAVFACTKMLHSSALELLSGAHHQRHGNPRNSSKGRHFYLRMIFLNMKGNLKRVLVTIVSIAGCCTLLMIGFMLYYAITRVAPRQYGEIQTYDYILRFDPEMNADAQKELENALETTDARLLPVVYKDLIFRTEDRQNVCILICAEEGTLDGWMNLIDVNTGKLSMPPESGIMVGKRFLEVYGLALGDTFTLCDASFAPHEVKIAGEFNNYLYEIMLISPKAWELTFDEGPTANTLFIKSEGTSMEELLTLVSGIPGFQSLKPADTDRSMFDSLETTSVFIAVLFIFLAGVMGWFILVNLSDVYMLQKTPELAIMRVNGFTVGECLIYAATEPVITTFLGVFCGLGLGALLGGKIVRMLEQIATQFARDIDWRALAISACMTIGFSFFVNGLALRRVCTLKLSR